MSILRVAVPGPLRTLLDYRHPEPLAAGVRVRVPLGREDRVGVVFGSVAESELESSRLRDVRHVLDDAPVIDEALRDLLSWASDYYQHPIGEVAAQALPVLARRARSARARPERALALIAPLDEDDPRLRRAPARARAAKLLAQAPGRCLSNAALNAADVSSTVRRTLVECGLAELRELPASAGLASATAPSTAPAAPPKPTAEQADAIAALVPPPSSFRCSLLEGVTGSGKTEVYFAAMRAALDTQRQVLLLVPEIGLTPQNIQRIRERFPEPLAVLHSGLADGERLAAWNACADGRAAIILGTRSAVFAPLPRPGLIVVDEEHDASYKQQEGFRYSARDLAVKRAKLLDVPVLLGSATPSLESLSNATTGRYQHLTLRGRIGPALPSMALVDLDRHGETDGLSPPLVAAISETLARGEQVLAFLNRRGFAPVLMCRSCGSISECPRCDARLTVHARPTGLRCHHCGYQRPLPGRCEACGDVEPLPVGVGTQRSEAALTQLFPDVPVLRIDRDAARSARALSERLEAIHSGEPAILVGTQMLAKGHHFPAVTLVAVLGADGGFFSADFRAAERQAQTLVQVAGRAGRAERAGRVIVQTRFPDHPLFALLEAGGYGAFAEAALVERRSLGLPPFGQLALLRAEATDREAPTRFLDEAAQILSAAQGGGAGAVEILGPVDAGMLRRAGRWRARLLLKAARRAPLHALLSAALPALDALPGARRVRWSLDVDPIDTY